MAEINWTRESEIWLEDIYGYIAADDPEAAERTVSLIYEKAQLLSEIIRGLATNTNPNDPARFAFSYTSITV